MPQKLQLLRAASPRPAGAVAVLTPSAACGLPCRSSFLSSLDVFLSSICFDGMMDWRLDKAQKILFQKLLSDYIFYFINNLYLVVYICVHTFNITDNKFYRLSSHHVAVKSNSQFWDV
jgi:hypothetical protein